MNFRFKLLFQLFLMILVVSSLSFVVFAPAPGSGSASLGEDDLACRDQNDCDEIDEAWVLFVSITGVNGGSQDVWQAKEKSSGDYGGDWVAYSEKYPSDDDLTIECDEKLTCGDLTEIKSGDNIDANSGSESNCAKSEVVSDFEKAAAAFESKSSKKIVLTSGFRTIQSQAELYWTNCYDKTGTGDTGRLGSCDPPTAALGISSTVLDDYTSHDEVINEFCENGNYNVGYHTKGTALDIWPEGTVDDWVANVKLMNQMQDKMEDNGFCRLASEGWHYDYKSSCGSSGSAAKGDYTYSRSGVTDDYDPVSECKKNGCALEDCWWDYLKHEIDESKSVCNLTPCSEYQEDGYYCSVNVGSDSDAKCVDPSDNEEYVCDNDLEYCSVYDDEEVYSCEVLNNKCYIITSSSSYNLGDGFDCINDQKSCSSYSLDDYDCGSIILSNTDCTDKLTGKSYYCYNDY
ncbi:hypothetical protein HOA92_01955 [archaeon]|jgi:hypothetical protein|nr:hypothetical protein [archaeon]MBT6761778.1 hypothetical protein [archaeon]